MQTRVETALSARYTDTDTHTNKKKKKAPFLTSLCVAKRNQQVTILSTMHFTKLLSAADYRFV